MSASNQCPKSILSKSYSPTGTVERHDTPGASNTATTSTSTALALAGHAIEKLQLGNSATTELPPSKTQELSNKKPSKQILNFKDTKNKYLTMKTNSPTISPTCPKKAKPTQTETFDDINDVPATLGHSPVPEGTPTHPFLYHGALAYGSPKKSKLANLMLPITPTPGDNQKTIKKHPTIAKKKRNFSNRSGATTDNDIIPFSKKCATSTRLLVTTWTRRLPRSPNIIIIKKKKKPTLACQLKKLPTIQRLLLPPSTVHRPTLLLVPTQLSLFMWPIQRLVKHYRPLRSAGSLFSRTVSMIQSTVPTNANNQDDDNKHAALPFFRIPTLFWSKSKPIPSRTTTWPNCRH